LCNNIINNVGYSTVDSPAPGGYKALTVAFDNVGDAKEIPIVDLVTVATPIGGASANVTVGDSIWRWDTDKSDWVKYYYRKLGTQAAVGWCNNGTTVVTTDTIPCGETFFFRRGTAGTATTLTLSGAVKEFTAQPSYTVAPGKFRFMGYPWPVEIAIADFAKFQGNPVGGASANVTVGDSLWLWDSAANDWVKYYYRKLGTQAAVGWCKNGTNVETTDTIPAGQGFFFRRGTAGAEDTITFTFTVK
jgi:hypothetical protein